MIVGSECFERKKLDKENLRWLGKILLIEVIMIFIMPYTGLAFRFDQVLVPFTVLIFSLFFGVNKKILLVFLLSITIVLLLPLSITLIKINLPGFYFSPNFFLRELQNILKFPFYFLFGYFLLRFASIKTFKQVIRISIFAVFILNTVTLAQVGGLLPGYRELKALYFIHPGVASMGRFPGVFSQPATAGMFAVVMIYVLYILRDKDQLYLIDLLVILWIGIIATSKVFILSLPFLLFLPFVGRIRPERPMFHRNKRFLLSFVIFLVIVGVLIYIFWALIVKSFDYIFRIIRSDVLARRGTNFVAHSIRTLLRSTPFFGNGLSVSTKYAATLERVTWDSLYFYDLYIYGVFGSVVKAVLFVYLFFKSFHIRQFKMVMLLLLLNLYVIGLGIPTFGQERIADFMWIFVGFTWTASNIYQADASKRNVAIFNTT